MGLLRVQNAYKVLVTVSDTVSDKHLIHIISY